MAIVIANTQDAPGRGGHGRLDVVGVHQVSVGIYTITMDSAQPAGGESIAEVFADFKTVLACIPVQITPTIANIRHFTVDHTNEKLIALKTLSSGANSEETGSLDGIVVRLVVFGYR